MTELSETHPAGTASARPPMPSLWRRSVGLAFFFTIFGPTIGTTGLFLFIFLFKGALANPGELVQIFAFGQMIGTPFAAMCGIILAVRAVFSGRVNILETVGAALAPTVILLVINVLSALISKGTLPTSSFPSVTTYCLMFAAPSLFAAIICRWLYYWLFWPRETKNASR